MATTEENLLSKKVSSEQSLNLHKLFTEKYYWTYEDWEMADQQESSLHKLINGMKYWKEKLSGAFTGNNLIVTLYNEEKDVYISVSKIIEAIEELNPNLIVTGFNYFRNPKYVGIDLETEDMKNYVLNNLKTVGENYVAFLSWALAFDSYTIRTHWLPRGIDTEEVSSMISKYFSLEKPKREMILLENNKKYEQGTLNFKGKLKKGIKMEEIPHISKVGKLECLLVISGRPPLCLNCGIIGHRSADCKTSFCRNCRGQKLKTHECNKAKTVAKSYAEVAVTDKAKAEDLDFKMWARQVQHVSSQEYYNNEDLKKGEESDTIATKVSSSQLSINDNTSQATIEMQEGNTVTPEKTQWGEEEGETKNHNNEEKMDFQYVMLKRKISQDEDVRNLIPKNNKALTTRLTYGRRNPKPPDLEISNRFDAIQEEENQQGTTDGIFD